MAVSHSGRGVRSSSTRLVTIILQIVVMATVEQLQDRAPDLDAEEYADIDIDLVERFLEQDTPSFIVRWSPLIGLPSRAPLRSVTGSWQPAQLLLKNASPAAASAVSTMVYSTGSWLGSMSAK